MPQANRQHQQRRPSRRFEGGNDTSGARRSGAPQDTGSTRRPSPDERSPSIFAEDQFQTLTQAHDYIVWDPEEVSSRLPVGFLDPDSALDAGIPIVYPNLAEISGFYSSSSAIQRLPFNSYWSSAALQESEQNHHPFLDAHWQYPAASPMAQQALFPTHILGDIFEREAVFVDSEHTAASESFTFSSVEGGTWETVDTFQTSPESSSASPSIIESDPVSPLLYNQYPQGDFAPRDSISSGQCSVDSSGSGPSRNTPSPPRTRGRTPPPSILRSTRKGAITKGPKKRSGGLSQEAAKNASLMRKVGNCVRCRMYKQRVGAPRSIPSFLQSKYHVLKLEWI